MGPGGYGGQRFAHDLGAPSTSHKVHGAAIYGNMDPINVPQMLAYISTMDPMGSLMFKAHCE